MINFPHQAMLENRGTVKWKYFILENFEFSFRVKVFES